MGSRGPRCHKTVFWPQTLPDCKEDSKQPRHPGIAGSGGPKHPGPKEGWTSNTTFFQTNNEGLGCNAKENEQIWKFINNIKSSLAPCHLDLCHAIKFGQLPNSPICARLPMAVELGFTPSHLSPPKKVRSIACWLFAAAPFAGCWFPPPPSERRFGVVAGSCCWLRCSV
jgi:hypothetical protein